MSTLSCEHSCTTTVWPFVFRLCYNSVKIPFSGSLLTCVSAVGVSATVERSLSNCFAKMVYTTNKKQHILHFYLKGYKAPNTSFLELKISCAVVMASQSLSRCSSVRDPFADRLVRVDHQRLLVSWRISSSSKWSEGPNLEICILPQQIFAKRVGIYLKGA